MSSTVTILTHGDLDGMVSGILLLRAIDPDASIRIISGDTLATELQRLVSVPQPPERVFVADIPLVVSAISCVIDCAAVLKDRGCRVHVYDHHRGWEAIESDLFATFIVDTDKTTAAAVIWRELLRGDRASQRWLRLLSEKDKSGDPRIVQDFGLLAALTQAVHRSQVEAALWALARGDQLSAEQAALSKWHYDVHVPKERQIASEALILTTSHNRKLAWIDLRPYRERYNVSRLAVEMHGADLVATVIGKGVLLGGAGIDQGVDLSFLHGSHALGDEVVTVVGHKSPVRISPRTETMTDASVAAIRQFILDRL